MDTKLVLRVLDADGALLAWAEVMAHARGDGALWAPVPSVAAYVERAGAPAQLSIHWADVNVECRGPLEHPAVVEGAVMTLTFLADQPVMRVGPMPGPLPPVTVRSPVSVAVPVGSLGALVG
jgi:hypothetical protein